MLTTSRTPLSYLFDCLLLIDTEWRKVKIRQHYTVLGYEEQVYLETERACVRGVVKSLRQLEKEVAQSVVTLSASRKVAMRALIVSFTKIRKHLDARLQESTNA